MDTNCIFFDNGPDGGEALFRDPLYHIIAREPEEVPETLLALETAQKNGHWLAGYCSYELGYALEPKLAPLMPKGRRTPLLHFAAFEGLEGMSPIAGEGLAPASLKDLRLLWDQERYAVGFDQVMENIHAGGYYQVNLTMPLRMQLSGHPFDLYQQLRASQPVPYGAFVNLGQGVTLLSRSPELFFAIDADRGIETLPMKGTAPRGATPEEDASLKSGLAKDEKNQAENLMIVDLLRNDISRIAEIGSVRVPDLFRVDTYETLHQMVSHVVGTLREDASLTDIFHALFPCGSITGAPKVAAMEAIRALESEPRDAYCGAIGWIAPDGSARFNVAIRTLAVYEGHEVTMNVGGGIVADSTAKAEYEEALWKARFATSLI